MKISNISIAKVENQKSVKGLATITLDNEFVVHNIRIVEGKKGLFIAMPSRKNAKGEFCDICHPITNNLRDHFSDQILKAYGEVEENSNGQFNE